MASDDWQVEQDLRTLNDAREIQDDPKRMKKVKALAAKKLTDMAAIASQK